MGKFRASEGVKKDAGQRKGKAKTMNGKGTIITIISVGIALSGLILNGQRTTNSAIENLRSQVNRDFAEVRTNITDLRERMARLEGLFEGHLERDD